MKLRADNFAVLRIENCVFETLSDLFTPDNVMELDEELLHDTSTETDKSQIEMSCAHKKHNSLASTVLNV